MYVVATDRGDLVQDELTAVLVTTLSDDMRLYSVTCAVPSSAACTLMCGAGPSASGTCSNVNPFEADVREYRIAVGGDEATIDFTFLTVEENAGGVTINGTAAGGTGGVASTVSLPLTYGLNTLVFEVTAEDPRVTGTYTFVVDREFVGAALNATLLSLTLADAATDIPLDFGFDSQAGAANYTVAIPALVTELDVSVVAFYPDEVDITMYWNGGEGSDLSDGASASIMLESLQEVPSGSNPTQMVTLVATAGGSVATYGLAIQRYGPGACTPRNMCDDWFPHVPPTIEYELPGLVASGVPAPAIDSTAPNFVVAAVASTKETTAPFAVTLKVTETTVTIATQLSEPGEVYYAVLPSTSSAPEVRAVLEGTVPSAVTAGSFTSHPYKLTEAVPHEHTITGLSASTAYNIHVVAQDFAETAALQAAPNAGEVVSIAATTAVAPPPQAPPPGAPPPGGVPPPGMPPPPG